MFGGVDFKKSKEKDIAENLLVVSDPEEIFLPLVYRKEQKNEILIKANSKVKKGTLVSKAKGSNAVNIFSPISGEVVEILKKFDEFGNTLPFARIKNDFKNEEIRLPDLLVKDQIRIIKRMSDAGLIDQDDKIPCHQKYLYQIDRKIETLIIDCVEDDICQNTKLYIIDKFTEDFIKGVSFFAIAADVKDIAFVFAQKDIKICERLKSFQDILQKWNVKYYFTSDKYPAHNKKLEVKLVTGRELKDTEKSTDFGIICESPFNCYCIKLAVDNCMPVTKNFISVYSSFANSNGIVEVKNGTRISHLIKNLYANEQESLIKKIVINSMMCGNTITDINISIDPSIRAIFILDDKESTSYEEMPCIYCNKCANVCPMKLMPMWIDKALSNNNINSAIKFGAQTCIDCGCCSFVCPTRRQITQKISIMKKDLQEKKYE